MPVSPDITNMLLLVWLCPQKSLAQHAIIPSHTQGVYSIMAAQRPAPLHRPLRHALEQMTARVAPAGPPEVPYW